MTKYELTNETIEHYGRTLYQTKALRDFGKVKKGEFGPYVQREANLRQEGYCWGKSTAKVYGNARVFGNAWVFDDARVFGDARIYGNARVSDNARVFDNAQVYGNARVFGNAQVFGDAQVYGDAKCSTSPFYCKFLQHDITVTDTHTIIGCECHPHEHWLINIENIGQQHEYSNQEIKDYKIVVTQLINSKLRILNND